MIKINNLNKFYNKGKSNEIHVINDVSLELPDTGFISILGQSGSGKTTLLNVIGGLDSATGSIAYDDVKFDGYKMSKIDEFRAKNIGYIFQNYNLVDEMTVFENLKIVLESNGITDKEEIKKRCDYILKAVGLYKYRKKLATELSGGQLQRVSIARALVKNAKIIIADEPTGNLDSNNSIEIMNILKKISEKSLVILVTHNKNLAEVYSDKILDIVDGKIVNIRDNNGNSNLVNNDSNNLYLKDYKSKTIEGDITTTIYSNEDISNVEFKVVYRNGTYYLDSNVKIELVQNTNLKLVNEHYEEKNIEKIKDEIEYDTSWFEDKVDEKSGFSRFKSTLAQAFKSFRSVRPRTKFLRVVLVIIGAILGFLAVSISSSLTVDTKDLLNKKDIYTLYSERKLPSETNKDIVSAYEQGIIPEYYSMLYISTGAGLAAGMSKKENSYSSKSGDVAINAIFGFDFIQNSNYIVGRASESAKEIVVDKAFADRVVSTLRLKNYEDVLRVNFTKGTMFGEYKICGIVDANYNLMYINPKAYINAYVVDTNSTNASSIDALTTSIVSGTKPEKEDEIVVSNKLTIKEEAVKVGDTIKTSTATFKVVGLYDDIDNVSIIYLSNDFIKKHGFSSGANSFMFLTYTFKTDNLKATKEYFNNLGYEVDTPYNFYKTNAIAVNLSRSIAMVVATIILLAIVIVYIYFTMRAQMISDIKSIGTLRSIGIKRSSITMRYLLETIITTIFTSFIGYALAMVLVGMLIRYLTGILGTNINVFATPYPYLGFVVILVFNVFFGILPIISLLRKTPSQIMAKYDI